MYVYLVLCIIILFLFGGLVILAMYAVSSRPQKPYTDYMHEKQMLELEKEKEVYVEEYKQLVKELREKVEKA